MRCRNTNPWNKPKALTKSKINADRKGDLAPLGESPYDLE